MRDLFLSLAARQKEDSLPSKISYSLFVIRDQDTADQVLDWVQQDMAARKAIHEFVRKTFSTSLLGLDVPPYVIGDDGYLARVTFNGWFTPQGWNGIPYTNMQQPESFEALQAVKELPQVPSRKLLHALIDWPTLDDSYTSKEQKKLITKINKLVDVICDGQETYLLLPEPCNFAPYPQIQQIIQGWQPPPCLEHVAQERCIKPRIAP